MVLATAILGAQLWLTQGPQGEEKVQVPKSFWHLHRGIAPAWCHYLHQQMTSGMLKPQFLCQSVLQKLPHRYFLLLIFVLLDTMDSLQYSANASAHSRLNKAKAGLDPIVFPSRLQNLVAVISIAFPFLKWKLVFSGRAGEQKKTTKPPRFNNCPPHTILKSPKFISWQQDSSLKYRNTSENPVHKHVLLFSPQIHKNSKQNV